MLPVLLLAASLGVLLFYVTEIAYAIVAARAHDGYVPLGFVSLAMDIYSYFSFIHQAAQGHWLFRNDMTHQPCDRVFFNLQWLVIGKCMGWFGWSPQLTFTIWRFAGSLTLMLGFAALAVVALPRTWQRVTALVMCAFGGGFGWVIAILGTFRLIDTSKTLGLRNPAIDLITAIHPFGQILKNPHYSLPHGTFLIVIALFITAERTRRARWYVAAAAMAVIQGLMRPYDLITICAAIPLFILIECVLSRKIDLRTNALRALPAVVSAPLVGYYYYIFSIHPVFKFWASQGDQKTTPIHWHTLGFGLAGLLFAWRILCIRKRPMTDPAERLLVVFAAAMFLLFHGNYLSRLLSFSPQIGISLMAPLILVAVGMLPALAERFRIQRPRTRAAFLVAFLAVNSIGSVLYVVWNANIGATIARNYLREPDAEAVAWLASRVKPNDVVLSTENLGSRIAFLLPVRVALGHWALTPDVKELGKKFERFVGGEMPRGKASAFIEEIRPRFIYVINERGAEDAAYFRRVSGATLAFSNTGVAIYELPSAPNATAAPREPNSS